MKRRSDRRLRPWAVSPQRGQGLRLRPELLREPLAVLLVLGQAQERAREQLQQRPSAFQNKRRENRRPRTG